MIERTFGLQAHGTTVRTELLAGLTTFMTMAYIIFVNPAILAQIDQHGGGGFIDDQLARTGPDPDDTGGEPDASPAHMGRSAARPTPLSR